MANTRPAVLSENLILAALPSSDRERLLASMDEIEFDRGDEVYRPNGPIKDIHFPRIGVLSMVIDTTDGRTVEVGTIGPEGFAGLPILHDAETSPVRVYCQATPCICRRLPKAMFQVEVRNPTALQSLANRYAQAHLNLAGQSIACNSLHPIEERLARWLLMTQDRVAMDELNLTQEILSEMLGVRRASVTTAAGTLQKAGLIEYRRGKIKVLDRAGLEAATCECYSVVRREFERLLGWKRISPG
jgi:CRP-like cAMP-binding protein